jgi:iron complex transport system substrate-binding protein
VDAAIHHSRRAVGAFLISLTVLFALTACTGSATSPSASSTPSPTPAASAAPFPVTLTDDEGTQVTIPTEPRRIVSLTPATTEILFKLGGGDRIVAKVEDLALYPPEAGSIPDVAKFGSVDLEKVVALEPDLVIAGGNTFTPPDAIEKMRSLGLPTLVVYAPTVEAVFADIELTGRAIGQGPAGADLAASMRAEFDQVAALTRSADRPRVFYEIDATGAIYGPADESFLTEMISLAGGDPITTGSPDKFDIPLERLIQADPEVILLGDAAYGVTAEQVAARPGWNVMTAVKSGAIRPIDDIVVTRPGPRLTEGLRALLSALHPDLVPAPAAP